MKKITSLLLLLMCMFEHVDSQEKHPHILVNEQDKKIILDKISQQPWANEIVKRMEKELMPYVLRHQKDPEWILSRYLMNRATGKHYTEFYSDAEGTALVSYAGNAPFPTVRVAPHKRPPVSKDGYSYKEPTIDELVPYDTSMLMLLQSNAPGGKKEWVNPQTYVDNINGAINQLALDASIIYWLTGNETYAKFGADILSQWARGAYFQNPINGPCRTGFLSIQTLGDGSYEPMPLVYDFLFDYLRKNNYETKWYEPVFEKIAHTMTFRGFWANNWYAAQTPAMVFSALALENKSKRDYYLQYYTTKDTINGGCGHLSIPSTVQQMLTPDGHWKEPGGYHNFPVSSLLISALAMEKNGYDIFKKNPALLDASYVMLKYSFPNLIAPSIGDTGPATQSAACLEIGLAMAKKYSNPILPQLSAALKVLMENNGYKREASDYLGLFSYLPELPINNNIVYQWPRSGELDFAKAYLQRNGTDKKNGLMYVVQGATYNHNHANGMSMELYGKGTVMGPDPGKGITYEAPLHVQYYAQWAAHNTVVAGASSASVPYFKGGGGTKKMGEIKLMTMEPKAGQEAVSAFCSFTDTHYKDISTNTNQERTMAIVRTSPTSGYYVDIYRSSHPKSNEYVYHNIGQQLDFLDSARKKINMVQSAFPISQKPLDLPGFRAIEKIQTTGEKSNNIIALFTMREKNKPDEHMQVLFAGVKKRSFYQGTAPETKTADPAFRYMKTPTLIARQEGEAHSRPFIAIYEPFEGDSNYTVDHIEVEDKSDPASFSAVKVVNRNGDQQLILQSSKANKLHGKNSWTFKGHFGVVNLVNGKPRHIYLGDGKEISFGPYSILLENTNGAANITINADSIELNCNQKTTLIINGKRSEHPAGQHQIVRVPKNLESK
jgi:hypothetical protein